MLLINVFVFGLCVGLDKNATFFTGTCIDGEKHCLPSRCCGGGGEGDPHAMAGNVIMDRDSLQDRDLLSGNMAASSKEKSSQELDMVMAFCICLSCSVSRSVIWLSSLLIWFILSGIFRFEFRLFSDMLLELNLRIFASCFINDGL